MFVDCISSLSLAKYLAVDVVWVLSGHIAVLVSAVVSPCDELSSLLLVVVSSAIHVAGQ